MKLLRDDEGGIEKPVILAVLLAVVISGMAIGSASLVRAATGSGYMARFDLAVDNYVGTYLASINANGEPNRSSAWAQETCTASLNACVSISAVADDSVGRTLTLDVSSIQGMDYEVTQQIRLAKIGVTHVAGVSAVGKPAWINDPADTQIPLYELTDIGDIPTPTPAPIQTR